jgi:DNA-directed RNA polymerase subunit RPC12/RpoP
MNRDYNPKSLRDLDRICVYRCSNCHRIFLLPFDAKDSKTTITCKGCGRYIDADADKFGDSFYPNEYPNVRFTIGDATENGKKPLLLIWFNMECRDCGKMNWIVWRGRLFDYNTCVCHEPVKKVESFTVIPAKPVVEDLVIENLTIPGEIVGLLKEYCFQHDIAKKDAIVQALHVLLEKEGL